MRKGTDCTVHVLDGEVVVTWPYFGQPSLKRQSIDKMEVDNRHSEYGYQLQYSVYRGNFGFHIGKHVMPNRSKEQHDHDDPYFFGEYKVDQEWSHKVHRLRVVL